MVKIIKEYLKDNPILGFSLNTHNQVTILIRLGQEIDYLLDEAVDGNNISHNEFDRAYGLFWLWVLGAFEVIRTMYVAKGRFSLDTQRKLKESKNRLIRIRAPFAKQKFAGRNEDIHGELSVSGFDADTRDFCFTIDGEKYWVRELISEFMQLIHSIGAEDIIDERSEN